MYRSGKSYLLNRLAQSPGVDGQLHGASGFYMGHTTEAKTKGIWLFAREHPEKEGHYMLLLDTEGLEDVNKSDIKHDNWIFCLATLLSSVLCYNDKSVINDGAVRKINFIADMSSKIRTKEADSDIPPDAHFDLFFPQFVYVVRDCDLEPTRDGKEISADEYLESCLDRHLGVLKDATRGSMQQGHVDNQKTDADLLASQIEDVSFLQEDDKSKKYIRLYFKDRKCFICTKPAAKKKMKKLDMADDSELDEDFVKEATEFCNYIFEKGKAKTLRNQQAFNGRMWGRLVEAFVESARIDKIPCLESAVKKVKEFENERLLKEYTEKYGQKILNEQVDNAILLKEKVVIEFIEKALLDYNGHFLTKLLDTIERIFNAQMRTSNIDIDYEMELHQRELENRVLEAIIEKQTRMLEIRGRAEVEKIEQIQFLRLREKERLLREKNFEDVLVLEEHISIANSVIAGVGTALGVTSAVAVTAGVVGEVVAGVGAVAAVGAAVMSAPVAVAAGAVVAAGAAGRLLGSKLGFW